jgi:hypothetical protein
MRNFLLLSLILLTYSCKPSKFFEVGSFTTDEIIYNDGDSENNSKMIKDLQREKEILEVQLHMQELYRREKDLDLPRKMPMIIDQTDSKKLLDNGFGTIAYNVPQKFVVDEYSTIKLRISKSKEIQSIIIGDRNIPIVGTDSNDDIILETIQIDSLMIAKLYTDDGLFEVISVNKNEEQSLSDLGYTEWVWRVRPLISGNHYIKMLITISGRDIVVYEKNILVESNWRFSFSRWFSRWWQAITATIITPILIPLFIWLYNRRKLKKD